jgi:hypothetical protein
MAKETNQTVHEHVLKVVGESDVSSLENQMKKLMGTFDKTEKSTKKITNSLNSIKTKSATDQFKDMKKALGGVEGAVLTVSRSFSQFNKATTTIMGVARSVASLAGATLDLKGSMTIVVDYNKELLQLSAQFAKYGVGIREVEGQLKHMSKQLNLTRMETTKLFQTYEKGFPLATLKGANNLLKNIRATTGSNVAAMQQMVANVGNLVSQYPELQRAAEDLAGADKERLKAQLSIMVATGKISESQYKSLQDYVSQNKQATEGDQNRKNIADEYTKTMGKMKLFWQEIAISIGKEVMPLVEKLSNFLKNNMDTVKKIASFIAKWVAPLVAVGAAMKVVGAGASAIGGAKTMAGGLMHRVKSGIAGARGGGGVKGFLSGVLSGGRPDGTKSKPLHVVMAGGAAGGIIGDIAGKVLGRVTKGKGGKIAQKLLGKRAGGFIGKLLGKGGSKAGGLLSRAGGLAKTGANLGKAAKLASGAGIAALGGELIFGGMQSNYESQAATLRERGDIRAAESAETKGAAAGLGKSAASVGGMALAGMAVGSAVPIIGTAIGGIVGGLVGFAMEFKNISASVETILGKSEIGKKVLTSTKKAWKDIKDAGGTFWSGIKELGSIIWDGIKGLVGKVWGAVKWLGKTWLKIQKLPFTIAKKIGGAFASTKIGKAVIGGAKKLGGWIAKGAKAAFNTTLVGGIMQLGKRRQDREAKAEAARIAKVKAKISGEMEEAQAKASGEKSKRKRLNEIRSAAVTGIGGKSAAALISARGGAASSTDIRARVEKDLTGKLSVKNLANMKEQHQVLTDLVAKKKEEKATEEEINMVQAKADTLGRSINAIVDERQKAYAGVNDKLKEAQEFEAQIAIIAKQQKELKEAYVKSASAAASAAQAEFEAAAITGNVAKAYEAQAVSQTRIAKARTMTQASLKIQVALRKNLVSAMKKQIDMAVENGTISKEEKDTKMAQLMSDKSLQDVNAQISALQAESANQAKQALDIDKMKLVFAEKISAASSAAAQSVRSELEARRDLNLLMSGTVTRDRAKTEAHLVHLIKVQKHELKEAEALARQLPKDGIEYAQAMVKVNNIQAKIAQTQMQGAKLITFTSDQTGRLLSVRKNLAAAGRTDLDSAAQYFALTGKGEAQFEKAYQNRIKLIQNQSTAAQEDLEATREALSTLKEEEKTGELYLQLKIKEKNVTAELAKLEKDRQEVILSVGLKYREREQVLAAEAQHASNMVSLMDNMVTGLGASVAMRQKQLEMIRQQRELVQRELKDHLSRYNLEEENITQRKRRLALQNKSVQMLQQEASVAKSMRDGWVSAINAQTIGSGRIAKLRISSDQNMRQSLQYMQQYRSALSGAVARRGEGPIGFTNAERFRATQGGGLSIDGGRTRGQGYAPDVGIKMDENNKMLRELREGIIKTYEKSTTRITDAIRGRFPAGLANQPGATSATTAPTVGTGRRGKVGKGPGAVGGRGTSGVTGSGRGVPNTAMEDNLQSAVESAGPGSGVSSRLNVSIDFTGLSSAEAIAKAVGDATGNKMAQFLAEIDLGKTS